MSLAPAQVIAISAPRSLTIVGRAGGIHREHKRYSRLRQLLLCQGRENDSVNGQYNFISVFHGRLAIIKDERDNCLATTSWVSLGKANICSFQRRSRHSICERGVCVLCEDVHRYV